MNDLPLYRILDRQKVWIGSERRLAFDVFEYSPVNHGYVFCGRHTARGWRADNAKCIAAFRDYLENSQ